MAVFFAVATGPILASFAATPGVLAEARAVGWWLLVLPFAGVAGFVLDGVYVGASWTRALLATMLGGTAVYAIALWLTWPLGNQGLWASFALFLLARAAFQTVLLPRLLRRTF